MVPGHAMSADTDISQEPGGAIDAHPENFESTGSSGTSDLQPEQRPSTTDTPAPQDTPPESALERDEAEGGEASKQRREQPYLDRIDEEERDWLRRQENLREIDAGEIPLHAGRDTIGRDYNRVSGGSVYYLSIYGSTRFGSASNGDSRAHVRYLPHVDAERLEACMVLPPSQVDLLSMLEAQSLLFLQGAESTGRTVAALHALLTWTQTRHDAARDSETAQVGVIVPRSSFHQAAPDLRKGHGYVLEPPSTGSARDLGVIADTMKEAADKQDCRLIILVPSDVSRPPGVVVKHRPPSASDVFARCLGFEAAAVGVDAHLLDGLREEIDDELRHETSPRQAAHMAIRLVASLKARKNIDEMRAELPRQQRDDIRRRLDEDKPVLGRCFMVSAAVLNGLQETIVSTAALDLVEHIKKVDSIKPEERLPVWEKLGTWLDYAAASIDPAQMSGGGRTVRISPPFERLTLRVFWEDHPTIRESLATWLISLSENASQPNVQMKAAHAAGEIATLSFPIAREKFIDPWARSRNLERHRLAAMMLESAVERDPDILPSVLDLLKELAKGTRHERLAAARIYGSSVGPKIFQIALQELGSIALDRDIEVCRTVAGSIGNLYSSETAAAIITELATWAGGEVSISEQYASALAFVRLARIAGGNSACTPLTDLQPAEAFVKPIAALWRNALDLRIVTGRDRRPELAVPDSWTVLAGWVRRYEEHQAVRTVVDTLLKLEANGMGAAGVAGLRRALALNLWKWEHQKLISRDLRGHLTKLLKGG
jgi:hypothetical protein